MEQRLYSDPAWHSAFLGAVIPAAQRRGALVGVDRARDVGRQARLAGGAGPNGEQGGISGYFRENISGRLLQVDQQAGRSVLRGRLSHLSRVSQMLTVLPMQGFDKGNRSVGKTKTRFRKAPKTDNVYIKLLVKVLPSSGPSRMHVSKPLYLPIAQPAPPPFPTQLSPVSLWLWRVLTKCPPSPPFLPLPCPPSAVPSSRSPLCSVLRGGAAGRCIQGGGAAGEQGYGDRLSLPQSG